MSKPSIFDSSDRPAPFIDELVQLFRYKDLLRELVARDIKTRYKRSVLGVTWTMLHPLLTMVILTVVFSSIFRFRADNYAIYLLSGLLIWNFFSTTILHAMTQLAWGGALLRRIYLPKAVFAVSSIGTGLVNLALAMIPLLLIMIVANTPISPALLFLPVAVVLTAMFALGMGLFLSTLAAYYTDVVRMFEILLLLWFYLTPILYPLEIVPEQFRWVVAVNPMTQYVALFRAPILEGTFAGLDVLGLATIWAVSSLVIGWWFFARQADELPYRV